MYTIIRPVLLAVARGDLETAHGLALWAIRTMQKVPPILRFIAWKQRLPYNNPVDLAGLTFHNRVGLAAGLDKTGEMVPFMEALGFGHVEIGTVPPRPQPGNPRPRIFSPCGGELINRMGFNSPGMEVVRENLYEVRGARAMKIGVSAGMNKDTPLDDAPSDYAKVVKRMWGLANYYACNVSSPNTPGLRTLQGKAYIEAVVRAMVEMRDSLVQPGGSKPPIFVKLAPDLTEEEVDQTMEGLIHGGADGAIGGNTTLKRPKYKNPVYGQTGGFSGGELGFMKAMVLVKRMRKAAPPSFPIIGVGSISSSVRARVMIDDAGADMVQVLTPLVFKGPSLITELHRATRHLRS
jgi:dihydroorotate dehydrogenase